MPQEIQVAIIGAVSAMIVTLIPKAFQFFSDRRQQEFNLMDHLERRVQILEQRATDERKRSEKLMSDLEDTRAENRFLKRMLLLSLEWTRMLTAQLVLANIEPKNPPDELQQYMDDNDLTKI